MANVEAEPEWEYHLQTELERSIVRENRVARVGWNTVRTVFPAVLGRAFVQWAAWGERLCVDGHSSFFPVAEMRYRWLFSTESKWVAWECVTMCIFLVGEVRRARKLCKWGAGLTGEICLYCDFLAWRREYFTIFPPSSEAITLYTFFNGQGLLQSLLTKAACIHTYQNRSIDVF